MSKKLMELVAKALKKANVELKDEVKSALAEDLGSDALKEAGLVELGSSQKLVEETEYNDLHADLRKTRKRAQDAESERDRIKGVLDTGDSENKRLAEGLKKDLDATKPLAEKLMKRAREDWLRKSALLPADKADAKDEEKKRVAKIRERFSFADKDKELLDEHVLSNLDKFDELSDLGVFEAPKPGTGRSAGGATAPPRTNPGTGVETPTGDVDDAYVDFYKDTDPRQPVGNAR